MKLLAAALVLLPTLMLVGTGHAASPLYSYDEGLSKIARESLWQAADEGRAIRRGPRRERRRSLLPRQEDVRGRLRAHVRRVRPAGHRLLRRRARHPPARNHVLERPPLLRRAEHRQDRRRVRDPPARVAAPAGRAGRADHDVLRERGGALGDALVRGERGEGAPRPELRLHLHADLRASLVSPQPAELPREDAGLGMDRVRLTGRNDARSSSTAASPSRAPPCRTARSELRGLAERRRSRTDRAVGYTTALVLKTSWATGPMPLQLRRLEQRRLRRTP